MVDCGCKGVRFCALCQNSDRVTKLKCAASFLPPNFSEYKSYVAVSFDSKLHYMAVPSKDFYSLGDLKLITNRTNLNFDQIQSTANPIINADFKKVVLMENFVKFDEEVYLIRAIDSQPWILSQSGRRKQDYGPKVNFKHKKLKYDHYHGMPEYAKPLLDKMQNHPGLADYVPFELCNLEYDKERGACIELHIDDTWIWGERLITLNLLEGSVMLLTCEAEKLALYIPMPRRSLLCMSGDMRYKWKHGIMQQHIENRRIALTMREPSFRFKSGELYEKWGRDLMSRGTTFLPVVSSQV